MELATTPSRSYTYTRYRNDFWDTRTDILKSLIAMRMRYPEIAAQLGTTVGAVCGKVWRLGIGMGPQSPQAGPSTPSSDLKEPDPEFFAIMARHRRERLDRSGKTTSLEDLEAHQCKFVVGEPRELQYCGEKRVPGKPYCSHHTKLCYQSANPLREAQHDPAIEAEPAGEAADVALAA